MHRLVGAVLIIAAGSLLGLAKSGALKMRAEVLEKIITGLGLLETDIGYGRKNLKRALSDIGEHHEIEFFKAVASEIDKKGAREAICSALSGTGQYLSERDKTPILALGENLGMTDGETQVTAIKRAAISLSDAKKEAEDTYKRLGRLYTSCGVLGGILVAIVLI